MPARHVSNATLHEGKVRKAKQEVQAQSASLPVCVYVGSCMHPQVP